MTQRCHSAAIGGINIAKNIDNGAKNQGAGPNNRHRGTAGLMSARSATADGCGARTT